MTPEQFVRQIAKADPMEPDGWENYCKFCHTAWGETKFLKYLSNQKKVDKIPADIRPLDLYNNHLDLWRARHEHHTEDCLWVLANKVIRENNQK